MTRFLFSYVAHVAQLCASRARRVLVLTGWLVLLFPLHAQEPATPLRAHELGSLGLRFPSRFVMGERWPLPWRLPSEIEEVEGIPSQVLARASLEAELEALVHATTDGEDDLDLRFSPRFVIARTTPENHALLANHLRVLRAALARRHLTLRVRRYALPAGSSLPVGPFAASDFPQIEALLSRANASLLLDERADAPPCESQMFEHGVRSRVLADQDAEGVAGAPPAFDPVVGTVKTGSRILIRQTPLASEGFVQLEVDVRHSELEKVRPVTGGGERAIRLECVDVRFVRSSHLLCVPRGGGFVLRERDSSDGDVVLVVQIKSANTGEADRERDPVFLEVGALLREPLRRQPFPGRPDHLGRAAPDDEVTPWLTEDDIADLLSLEVDDARRREMNFLLPGAGRDLVRLR